MTFTVTYRAKDGAMREERIEAANRAECMAVCRKRGITPARIAEGVKGRDKRGPRDTARVDARPPSQHRLTGKAAILAAVVLVAIGGGVWWWCGGRGATALPAEKPKAEKPAKPKTARPESAPKTETATNAVAPVKAPETNDTVVATNDPYGGEWHGQKIVSYTVKTNGWSTYERIVTADGKKHGVVGSTVKPIFDNGSDQLLAMAVRSASQETGMPPMPLSPLVESDFLESLKKPIVINDDDSEEVKQLKRDVAQAREDMMDMVKNGMTVQQALEEHFKMSNENVDIRNKAVDELRALVDSGDMEAAATYIETVNATLEKMGIMKLELPEERVRGRKKKEQREETGK